MHLLLLFVVLAIMSRSIPGARGCWNTFGQQVGSSVGKLAGVALTLLALFYGSQIMFQSCVASITGHHSPQVSSPSLPPAATPPETQPPFIPNPKLPELPDIPKDLGSGMGIAFSPPLTPYDAGSYRGRVVGTENHVAGIPPLHLGEDIAEPYGTPVYCVADGEVVLSSQATGYGWVTVVEHKLADGTLLLSIYGHLSPRQDDLHVPLGAIGRGQQVGVVAHLGENGGSFGEHLHMGLRVVGQKRDYKPGVRGLWYRGYGKAEDIGQIGPDGVPTGGQYVPFSQLLKYGLNRQTRTVGPG